MKRALLTGVVDFLMLDYPLKKPMLSPVIATHLTSVLAQTNVILSSLLTPPPETSTHSLANPRREDEWINSYLRHDFKVHFGMSVDTFKQLLERCQEISNKREEHNRGGHHPIPYYKSLQSCLWYLSKGDTLSNIADHFKFSVSCAYALISSVIDDILSLLEEMIFWPSESEAQVYANEFLVNTGYPFVIGAIDGCHIPAKVPSLKQETFLDRKFFPTSNSIKLQGICSYRKEFLDVSTGWPGSFLDATVLEMSEMYEKLLEKSPSFLFYDKYLLVGDSAYPLDSWLIKAYRASEPTKWQLQHDRCLEAARQVIDQAFTDLKCRWKILRGVNTYSIEKASKIVISACILHNFCVRCDDEVEQIGGGDVFLEEQPLVTKSTRKGEVRRNEIALMITGSQ